MTLENVYSGNSGGEVVWRYERSDSPLIDTKNIAKLFINDWVIAVQDSEMIIGDQNVSYDYLISGSNLSGDITSIERIVDEIDWTSAWSKKYPILATYQGIEGIQPYCQQICNFYDHFKNMFNLNDEDTVLILKDMLYQKFKSENKKNKIK